MKKVFVSYTRKDLEVVKSIVDDLTTAGLHEPWYDQDLEGGKEWWEEIIRRIQECDLFLVIVSRGSLESEACQLETQYAAELGKEVLPVTAEKLSPNLLPEYLATRQIVDYYDSPKAGLYLVRAIEHAKPSKSLPEVLPAPPRVPISYLVELRDQILNLRAPLSLELQRSLVLRLRNAKPDDAEDAIELLERMRAREDAYAVARDEADNAIAALQQSVVITESRDDKIADEDIIVTDFPHDRGDAQQPIAEPPRQERRSRDDIGNGADDESGRPLDETHWRSEARDRSDLNAASATSVRSAVERRNETDYVFNFWTSLAWTIVSLGLYVYYIFFQLIRRNRDHNGRRFELIDAARNLAWEEAGRQHLQEDLRSQFSRLAEQLTALDRMRRRSLSPEVWVLLAIFTGGIGLLIGFVVIDKDLLRHCAAEAAAQTELETILLRLGCSVTPGFVTLKGAHNYGGRTLALICSVGLYAIWWVRDLELEGNRHFQENWVWEDSLLSSVAA